MEIDFLTLFMEFSNIMYTFLRRAGSMGPALVWAMGSLGFRGREVPELHYLVRRK